MSVLEESSRKDLYFECSKQALSWRRTIASLRLLLSKAKPTPPSVPRLSVGKKVLFAAVATLIFFAVVEGILTLGGVRPLLYDEDPHVGFASSIPLFVEGTEGQMVTATNKVRWFNEQRFSRKKSSEVTRVFCVGGSTTYGRPYNDATSFCGWLREYLPAADPSQKWELINAGGISYASYRVAKLMEELIEYDPDVFVIYSGHNEFLEERTYSGIIKTPEAVRGLQSALGHTRTYSFMSGLMGRRRSGETGRGPVLTQEVYTILDNSAGLDRYTRDPVLEAKIQSHYRYNLARMVDIAQSAGAKVVFVTPAANVRDSSPFKSEHVSGLTESQKHQWEAHQDNAEKQFQAKHYDDALSAIDQALAIDGGYAHSHFLRGQVLQALGRAEDGRAAYVTALENDVCPLRILPEMREILAETAADRKVPLFDYHAFLSKRSEFGAPGENWFLDHVHPTVTGHRLLALELIPLLTDKNALSEDRIQTIEERVLTGLDDQVQGVALRNLGNVLNWAGKKREAYNVATKALTLAPGDAYAHYLAGDLAGFFGKTSEAEAHFRELTRFSLDPKDAPYFPDAHYQLAKIIGARGEAGESVRLLTKALQLQPDHSGSIEALPLVLEAHGKELLKRGRFAEAAAAFTQLEKISPSNVMATNLLGVALIQEKKFPEAIAALIRAAAKDERNPTVHNNLGSAYARSNQSADAERHFKLAIQYHPGHAGAHLNLARLLESANKREEAADHYQAVLRLNPNSTEAQEGLVRTK
jgi:tetratricopeptide (TPR) repeat protein